MINKKKILTVVLCGGAFILLAEYIYLFKWPEYKHRSFYTRHFRDAEKIEIYSYASDQRVVIENREDIKLIWEKLDLWKFDGIVEEGNVDDFVYISYSIESPDEPGQMLEFAFPIYVGRNGVVLFGMPPRRENYWYRPELTEAMMNICEKHNIDITPDPNKIDLEDDSFERELPVMRGSLDPNDMYYY